LNLNKATNNRAASQRAFKNDRFKENQNFYLISKLNIQFLHQVIA